jgi:hypothetical protein
MIELGYYRHFKGNKYQVIAIAKHSETEEEMVVYQSLNGDQGIWVRPLSMWTEMVVRDGKTLPRFEKIN